MPAHRNVISHLYRVNTDYIIVGQGLCGSWLSYYLRSFGASVIVVDGGIGASASYAASGIINPVTGKRLARQWMGDTILPFATAAYEAVGRELGLPLIAETAIHTFFSTSEEGAHFAQKAASASDQVLHENSAFASKDHFNSHYGTGTIHPAWLVDVHALLRGWRLRLSKSGALLPAAFDWNDCVVDGDGVSYKGVRAKAVIDCSGAAAAANPYFSRLPFALNKGEAILGRIPGLAADAIYKYAHLSIVPWEGGRFWIGSTFDWDFRDELPTAAFRQKAEQILSQWLRLPFVAEEQIAAIRPATVSRDPFSGMHPAHPRIGLLNGTGSKGCALAPFLAHDLALHLVRGEPLLPQVDLRRYEKTLSR